MNTTEVLNTPGYYYAIAYALSVFVIACTNERKLGRWKLAAVSCVQFALLLFFMTETDGVRQELFIPSMMVIVGLLLGYIYICNDFSFKEAGFYCVKAFINGEFVLADLLLSAVCAWNARRTLEMGGTCPGVCSDFCHIDID